MSKNFLDDKHTCSFFIMEVIAIDKATKCNCIYAYKMLKPLLLHSLVDLVGEVQKYEEKKKLLRQSCSSDRQVRYRPAVLVACEGV